MVNASLLGGFLRCRRDADQGNFLEKIPGVSLLQHGDRHAELVLAGAFVEDVYTAAQRG
jgi:hypothetical protein